MLSSTDEWSQHHQTSLWYGMLCARRPHVLTVRTGGKPDAPSAPGARIAPVATAPAVSGIDGAKTGGAVPNASTAGQLQTQQGGAGGGGKAGARSAFKFPESGTKAKAPAAPTVRHCTCCSTRCFHDMCVEVCCVFYLMVQRSLGQNWLYLCVCVCVQEPHQAGYQHASGEVTPQWELIHRGQVRTHTYTHTHTHTHTRRHRKQTDKPVIVAPALLSPVACQFKTASCTGRWLL